MPEFLLILAASLAVYFWVKLKQSKDGLAALEQEKILLAKQRAWYEQPKVGCKPKTQDLIRSYGLELNGDLSSAHKISNAYILNRTPELLMQIVTVGQQGLSPNPLLISHKVHHFRQK